MYTTQKQISNACVSSLFIVLGLWANAVVAQDPPPLPKVASGSDYILLLDPSTGEVLEVDWALEPGDSFDPAYPFSIDFLDDGSGNALNGFAEVAAGRAEEHDLFLLSDGTVMSWGDSYNSGQFEDELRLVVDDSDQPISDIVKIADGEAHSIALTSSGTILSWGDNSVGQLGNGAPVQGTAVPLPVLDGNEEPITNAVDIAAGNFHNLAILDDGSVIAWGKNTAGQLGDGTTTDSPYPVTVLDQASAPISGASAIAAGTSHSVALLSDGSLLSWGDNTLGQLGDNDTAASSTAVTVVDASDNPIDDVIAVVAGENHTAALLTSSQAIAWGDNGSGQLCDDSTTASNVPVSALDEFSSPLTGVAVIAAGDEHTVFLNQQGELLACGDIDASGSGPVTTAMVLIDDIAEVDPTGSGGPGGAGGGAGPEGFSCPNADVTITGTLSNSDGDLLANVIVGAFSEGDANCFVGALTDANGAFSLDVEADAEYRVIVGGECHEESLCANATIDDSYLESLVMSGALGNPGVNAQGYRLGSWDESWDIVSNVPVGYIDASNGATLGTLVLMQGISISGHAEDANGSLIANLSVFAEPVCEGGPATGGCSGFASTETDSNGDYVLRVSPGSYRINAGGPITTCDASGCVDSANYPHLFYADDNGSAGTTSNWDDATIVTIDDQPVTGIDFSFPQTISITGTIRANNGDPIANLGVNAEPLFDQESGIQQGDWAWAQTDSSGVYSLQVVAGTYRLSTGGEVWSCDQNGCTEGATYPWGYYAGADDDDNGSIDASEHGFNSDHMRASFINIDGEGDISVASFDEQSPNSEMRGPETFVPLASGVTVDVTFPATISITGTMRDGTGAGIANMGVNAEPVFCSDAACGGQWGWSQTDSNGDYSLQVTAGTYRINSGGDIWLCDQNGCESGESYPWGFYGGDGDGDDNDGVTDGQFVSDWFMASFVRVDTQSNISVAPFDSNSGFEDDSQDRDNFSALAGGSSIDIDFPKTLVITGTVTDSDGNGVGGLGVNAEPLWDHESNTQLGNWTWSETSRDSGTEGQYSLRVVPGTYRVSTGGEVWNCDQNGCSEGARYPWGFYAGSDADDSDTLDAGEHDFVSDWMRASFLAVDEAGDITVAAFDPNAENPEQRPSSDFVPLASGVEIDVQFPQTLTISGTITDSSGNPVANIGVNAEPDCEQDNGAGCSGQWAWDETDSNGQYSLQLTAGDYRVSSGGTVWSCSAWTCEEGDTFPFAFYSASGATSNWDEADVVALSASPVSGIDLQFPTTTELAGRITDSDGNPIPFINVNIEPYGGTGSWSWAQTDDNGEFAAQVADGSYRIGTGGDVWRCDHRGCEELGRYPYVFYMAEAPGYTPNWDAAGKVTLSGSSLTVADPTSCNFDTWPPQCEFGTPVTISDGIDIQFPTSASITGTLSDGSTGIADAEVNVWSESGAGWGWARTDSSGNFAIEGVTDAADYRLEVFSNNIFQLYKGAVDGSGCSSDCFTHNWDDVSAIAVAGSDKALGSITLAPVVTRSISGTVSGAEVGGDGQNVWIHAWSESQFTSGFAQVTADDNGDGSFTMTVPEADDYRVRIDPDWNSGLTGGFYREQGVSDAVTQNWDGATLVDVTGGDYSDIAVALSAGGTISGSVTLVTPAGGTAVSGADVWVDVYSEQDSAWGGSNASYSSDNGNGDAVYTFSITGLSDASDYRLSVNAMAQGSSYPHRFFSGAADGSTDDQTSDWERATLLEIDAGNTISSIDLTLGGGNTISGTVSVTGAGNEFRDGVLYIWLDAWSESTWQWGGIPLNISVDSSGAGSVDYSLPLDSASDWKLQVHAPGLLGTPLTGVDNTAGNVSGADINLSTGASISGTVTRDGSGVAGVWVEAFFHDANDPSNDFWGGGTLTDVNGDYLIDGLASLDDWTVVAYPPSGFAAETLGVDTTSGDVSDVDIALAGAASFTQLTGSVCDNSDGSADFSCTAGTSEPISEGWIGGHNEFDEWVGVDIAADGSYSVDLSDGVWQLKVWTPNYPDAEAQVSIASGSIVSDFSGGAGSAFDFELNSGSSISGTVTGFETAFDDAQANGEELFGCVAIFEDDGDTLFGSEDSFVHCPPISRSGNYASPPLAAGDYFLLPEVDGFPGAAASSLVSVSGTDLTGIDLALPDTSSNIDVSGTVSITASFTRVVVAAFDGNSDLVDGITLDGASDGSTPSFSLEGLPAGTYTIKALGYSEATSNGVTTETVTQESDSVVVSASDNAVALTL